MLESGLKPIAEKALDFLCILPTCDEAHPLPLKAVNVALPILGALVVIGVGAKLLSQRNVKPTHQWKVGKPSKLPKDRSQITAQPGTNQASAQYEALRSKVLRSLGEETLTQEPLALFQKAKTQYDVACQNRSTNPAAFIKAADRKIKVAFYISDYALTNPQQVIETARKNPRWLKENGLSEQCSDLEILKKTKNFMDVIQYFSRAYHPIMQAYDQALIQGHDLHGKAANWKVLYKGYTDMMKQGQFLERGSF